LTKPGQHRVATWVVCMCADWCRACGAYRDVFSGMADALAEKYPDCRFVWIDVEDHAELVGDLDIETFPTLLVASDDELNFLGAVTPQPEVLARLLESLLEPGARQMAHRPETLHIIEELADRPELRLQAEFLSWTAQNAETRR
jgi:thioredoxin 1